jgi:hypothetical protein
MKAIALYILAVIFRGKTLTTDAQREQEMDA